MAEDREEHVGGTHPKNKKRSRCVLLVACCLWIYLASQEFSCLVPMLAKRGRRQLACCPGFTWAQSVGAFRSMKTLLTPLISGSSCQACTLEWTRDQSAIARRLISQLTNLEPATISAEFSKFFYMLHAKRIRATTFSFVINSLPLVVVFFWKVRRSKISFT